MFTHSLLDLKFEVEHLDRALDTFRAMERDNGQLSTLNIIRNNTNRKLKALNDIVVALTKLTGRTNDKEYKIQSLLFCTFPKEVFAIQKMAQEAHKKLSVSLVDEEKSQDTISREVTKNLDIKTFLDKLSECIEAFLLKIQNDYSHSHSHTNTTLIIVLLKHLELLQGASDHTLELDIEIAKRNFLKANCCVNLWEALKVEDATEAKLKKALAEQESALGIFDELLHEPVTQSDVQSVKAHCVNLVINAASLAENAIGKRKECFEAANEFAAAREETRKIKAELHRVESLRSDEVQAKNVKSVIDDQTVLEAIKEWKAVNGYHPPKLIV